MGADPAAAVLPDETAAQIRSRVAHAGAHGATRRDSMRTEINAELEQALVRRGSAS